MRLFLVRHGQSEGNANNDVYLTKSDSEISLTEKGKRDAAFASDRIWNLMERLRIDENPKNQPRRFNLFHSTYKRATQTAEIIKETLSSYDNYTVDNTKCSPLCREREWGDLRGIVNTKTEKTNEHFNFYYRPTNGESFVDVFQRAAIFHQWLSNTKYYDNIVVAHGEFNKVYLMYLLGWDTYEFDKWANQLNGEVWVVEDNKLSSMTPLRKSRYF